MERMKPNTHTQAARRQSELLTQKNGHVLGWNVGALPGPSRTTWHRIDFGVAPLLDKKRGYFWGIFGPIGRAEAPVFVPVDCPEPRIFWAVVPGGFRYVRHPSIHGVRSAIATLAPELLLLHLLVGIQAAIG